MKLDTDDFRKNLNKYTDRAFQQIPYIERPRILDVGCGTGEPTLRLVELSNGEVLGIDIDKKALEKFDRKIKEKGLDGRVKTRILSHKEMDFDDESFDIIWCEGALYDIEFEDALRDWKRYLKEGGYLVIHDELGDYNKKKSQVEPNGYKLLRFFMLGNDIWGNEYFSPLKQRIKEGGLEDSEDLRRTKKEIEEFHSNLERNKSAYFVMRKK